MRPNTLILTIVSTAAIFSTSANATEPGGPAALTKAGVLIGASAGVPAPGIYMFDQFFTYQASIVGPLSNAIGKPHVSADVNVEGFLFVPGWTFLGGTYDAVIAQPFASVSVGSPFNAQSVGVYNTFIAPIELSWKIPSTGFVVKSGLGIWTPDGTTSGPAGLSNVGNPFWTFQPEVIFSYLKDGYNLTAAVYEEFHTANTVTGYTTGNVLHADFTATKTIGKWTFGPVAYYEGQVTSDKSSAYYGYALGTNRYNVWAVGGLVEYNFGPASLSVWATQEVSAKASGATIGAFDPSSISQGTTVFATLSYRIWSPDDNSAPKKPLYTK